MFNYLKRTLKKKTFRKFTTSFHCILNDSKFSQFSITLVIIIIIIYSSPNNNNNSFILFLFDFYNKSYTIIGNEKCRETCFFSCHKIRLSIFKTACFPSLSLTKSEIIFFFTHWQSFEVLTKCHTHAGFFPTLIDKPNAVSFWISTYIQENPCLFICNSNIRTQT